VSGIIGVFTSGGDCCGLNAAIRAVTLKATSSGKRVFGFRFGSDGLIRKDFVELTPDVVSHSIFSRGGSFLGCMSKGGPLVYENDQGQHIDTVELFANAYKDLGLESIIAIGGDGSFSIMQAMMNRYGINVVGIPKTIDNDLGEMDISIGFSSGVQRIVESIDALHMTGESHQRTFVVQVMGRDAGHLALAGGIASAADIILIPEIAYTPSIVAEKLKSIYTSGRKSAIVVVAESIRNSDGSTMMVKDTVNNRERYEGAAHYLSGWIEETLGIESRPVVLGHVQRGGVPTAFDRILASQMGVTAVELALQHKYGTVVVLKNNKISYLPIQDTIKSYNAVELDSIMVRVARGLNICLGDQY
jgi:6-phosphofructokinase